MRLKRIPNSPYGSNFVPGDGPVPCDVVLIGEAPGETEDELMIPFVGRSGKYLRKMLNRIGLYDESVYITNAVKSRPPKNMTPTRFEIEHYRHYLHSEIHKVYPRTIVCLGRVAVTALMGIFYCQFSLDVLSKQKLYLGERRVYVTYHPVAAMRDKKRNTHLNETLKKVKKERT